MPVIDQIMVDVWNVVVERDIHIRATDTSSATPPVTADTSALSLQTTPTGPSPTMSGQQPSSNGGPTSSPLLFFVALGFGVVFTNLWIIVGVKYCFRYNARNRAIRNGEDIDPINLEHMPTRPHRRRREKKLMSMEEVNERFPSTKYKTWIASRSREGLATSGGVVSPPSRMGSVRSVDVQLETAAQTKQSIDAATLPISDDSAGARLAFKPITTPDLNKQSELLSEKVPLPLAVHDNNRLEEVKTIQTTTDSTVNKHVTSASEDYEEDEDDHIHTAVPPELLTNPGDSCAICIDTLEEDDDVRGLTCGHAFHAGCLDPWLTSRRACCPLCKADYYTPKPRLEGDGTDADRSGRRRGERGNMPRPVQPSWRGFRSNSRILILGRVASGSSSQDRDLNAQTSEELRSHPRPVDEVRGAISHSAAMDAAVTQTVVAPSTRRVVPRVSNIFSNISMPTIRILGRHQASNSAPNTVTEPSLSQLESGVVR